MTKPWRIELCDRLGRTLMVLDPGDPVSTEQRDGRIRWERRAKAYFGSHPYSANSVDYLEQDPRTHEWSRESYSAWSFVTVRRTVSLQIEILEAPL